MDDTSRIPRRRMARLATAAALAVASLGLPPPRTRRSLPPSRDDPQSLPGRQPHAVDRCADLPTFRPRTRPSSTTWTWSTSPPRSCSRRRSASTSSTWLACRRWRLAHRTARQPGAATELRYDYLALLMTELATPPRLRRGGGGRRRRTEAPAGAAQRGRAADHARRRPRAARRPGEGDRSSSGHFVNNLVFLLAATGGTANEHAWLDGSGPAPWRACLPIREHPPEPSIPASGCCRHRSRCAARYTQPTGSSSPATSTPTGTARPEQPDRLLTPRSRRHGRYLPILHPGQPGYTAGLGDDLTQPADAVEHRIDMVMFRGAVVPVTSQISAPSGRPRWPLGVGPPGLPAVLTLS
jgi:hypothetical protein